MSFLQKVYSRDDFLGFVKDDFLPDFVAENRPVRTHDKSLLKEVQKLGESSGLALSVFEAVCDESDHGKRVAITLDAFRILRDTATRNALVVFYSKNTNAWRLSLLTSSFELDGSGKVTTKISNTRRYSYLLGENTKTATPHKYLEVKGRIKDFNDLKSRFAVEVVNNDFYKEIAKLYDELVGTDKIAGSIKYPGHGEVSHQFAVRLIGRIIFCWFLREKRSDKGTPLIPSEVLSGSAAKNNNYYHNVLAPLFFEILNKRGNSRIEKFQTGLYATIPYLNGGLFNPDPDDHYKFDKTLALSVPGLVDVPDKWLRSFFDLLELYNFTVDENTSYDVELSIDPEMLGRIFENLLARINPDTGETVRKMTGSFYTPREVVDYMVDESLKQYLRTESGVSDDKLSAVITFDLHDDERYPLNDDERQKITDSLSKIKILDPACGSGAFPIGILQKIVFILQQVDPDSKKWIEKQLIGASPEFRHHLEREFENKNFNYLRKLGVIRESIYGVDIQPIATEISRLRCFLTLVVDQSVDDDDDNRGIEPLPNLDFKFVTANSLLKLRNLDEANNQTGLFEDTTGIDELRRLRGEYFSSHNHERESLKLQFSDRQNQMLQDMIANSSSGFSDLTRKLSTWKPFSHRATDWFDPEWMFGISEGFNIVIGNPPYNAKLSKDERSYYKDAYQSVSSGRQDTAAIFVEFGNNLLASMGILSYILPYRLFSRKRNHGAFQDYLVNNASIKHILYLGSDVGFTASDEFMVIVLAENEGIVDIAFKPDLALQKPLFVQIRQEEFIKRSEVNLNLAKFDQNLIAKIEANHEKLDDICNVRDGIVPFIREKLISTTKLDPRYEVFVGISGKYKLEKYHLEHEPLYICYDINEAKKYITDPIELRKVQLRDISIFTSRKILTAQNSSSLKGTIDEEGLFVSNSLHSTYLKNDSDENYSLEYVLALLNSKLLNFYHDSLRLKATDLHPQILLSNLKKLPIAKPSTEIKEELTSLVKDLMSHYGSSNLGQTETKINELVYKLYDLSSDEIAIVENSSK